MSNPQLSPAEATDQHGRRLATCMAIAALLFGANAAERLVGPDLERILDIGQIALVVLIVVLLIPLIVWKFAQFGSVPSEQRAQYFASDSFMIHTMKKARALSWSLTFASLVVLGIASRVYPDVPAKVFLDIALTVMFGVFAVTVLALNR